MMQAMIVTLLGTALLFSTGFLGGYFARATFSIARRNKIRRGRDERMVDRINGARAQNA